MKWEKRGYIAGPDTTLPWSQRYGILPTPVYLKDIGVIRVYYATTCKELFGRITYIDLDPKNPSQIISNEKNIALDIGELGSFDDCGVNPSSLLIKDNKFYMYYAGYQRHCRVPYSILSGLAISKDGEKFERIKSTPILERTSSELNLRSAPTVMFINDRYHMWYVSSLGWERMSEGVHSGKMMPRYCIRHTTSEDGVTWGPPSEPIFNQKDDEFGFGRPWIYKEEKSQKYYLFYSVRSKNKSYRIGYATSEDLINWERKDQNIGIDVSGDGWDSEMICYPAVVSILGKTYLFYNGNNNGDTGFGFAELVGDL